MVTTGTKHTKETTMTELINAQESTEAFYNKLNNGGYITRDGAYILSLDWKSDIKILNNPAYTGYKVDGKDTITFDEDLENELNAVKSVIEAVSACRRARAAVRLADQDVKSLNKDAE